MGDRAQVKIVDASAPKAAPVFLYTHSGGHSIRKVLAAGLKRAAEGARLGDSEYAARILFCEMVCDDIEGTTGYGIGTAKHGDLNRPLITVTCGDAPTVQVGNGAPVPVAAFLSKYIESDARRDDDDSDDE